MVKVIDGGKLNEIIIYWIFKKSSSKDWVLKLNSRLTFYYRLPVVKKSWKTILCPILKCYVFVLEELLDTHFSRHFTMPKTSIRTSWPIETLGMNWTYMDILEIFWASFVRSVYILCPGSSCTQLFCVTYHWGIVNS